MKTIATWGDFVFYIDPNNRVIKTFSDFTRKASYKTEQKESGKNKPRTVNKGPELSTCAMKTHLKAALGVDVEAEVARWLEACDAGTPHPLTIGSKKYGKNQWQIKDIQQTNSVFDGDIRLIDATLQINFVEFVGAGSEKTTTSSSRKPTTKPQSTPQTTVTPALGAVTTRYGQAVD